MSIQGKVIAINGASSGIDRATARLLAARGARVVLGARREAELATLAEDITDPGGEVAHKVTDVTCRADMQALITLAVERWDRLDVLINNAGIGPISRLRDPAGRRLGRTSLRPSLPNTHRSRRSGFGAIVP